MMGELGADVCTSSEAGVGPASTIRLAGDDLDMRLNGSAHVQQSVPRDGGLGEAKRRRLVAIARAMASVQVGGNSVAGLVLLGTPQDTSGFYRVRCTETHHCPESNVAMARGFIASGSDEQRA